MTPELEEGIDEIVEVLTDSMTIMYRRKTELGKEQLFEIAAHLYVIDVLAKRMRKLVRREGQEDGNEKEE